MRFVVQKGKRFICRYCGFSDKDREVVEKHLDAHELVFVPIAKSDINKLNQFFFLRNEELIPTNFVRVLQQYIRQITREE